MIKCLKVIKISICFLLVIGVFAIVYVTFIERNLLISHKYNINLNEDSNKKLKVVQFSDTHLGDFYSLNDLKRVVKKINKAKPDIVVFTGDLMDNASRYDYIYDISDVLVNINAKLGKYAIYGNRDYGGGAVRYYEEIMQDSGFQLLVNQSVKIPNTNVNLFGVDDKLLGDYDIETTMVDIDDDQINILLLHEPDLVDDFTYYPVDLALAGHTHGGQIYIPFKGPLVTTALGEKYFKGFYQLDNKRDTTLYVNSGLGNSKYPFRLFNVPQISIFNLTY